MNKKDMKYLHKNIKAPMIIILLLFIIMFQLSLLSIPIEASTIRITPQIKIYIDTPEVFVDVSPGSLGIAKIKGTVHVQTTFHSKIIVRLYGHSDLDFQELSISPIALSFEGSGEMQRTFEAGIRVPLYEDCNKIIKYTIGGSYTCYEPFECQGSLESITGEVRVEQFHKFQVSTHHFKKVEIGSGNDVEYNIHITNSGNGEDEFEVTIENKDYLENKGLKVLVSNSTINISAGERKTVDINIKLPDGWREEVRYLVKVKVVCRSNDWNGEMYQIETLKIDHTLQPSVNIIVCCATIVVIFLIISYFFIIVSRIKLKKKKQTFENLK
jgi:hypothetical protein